MGRQRCECFNSDCCDDHGEAEARRAKEWAEKQKKLSDGAVPVNLKQHVQGMAHFEYYLDGNLWYATDSGFRFPVPSTNSAHFYREDKAIFFMRWIRKHMELSKAASTEDKEK